jgi:hypothetical protein
MSFICPIQPYSYSNRPCARVDVPLTIIGLVGEVTRQFRFDTGCDITTVSEDVALALGLPTGGTPIHVRGSTGFGVGRLVAVTFRFPPDAISGLPRAPVSSEWVVIASHTNLALLSFQDVHDQFFISTDDAFMYFTKH